MSLGDLETEKRLIDNLILGGKIAAAIIVVFGVVLLLWKKKNNDKIEIEKSIIAKKEKEDAEKLKNEVEKNTSKMADIYRTLQQLGQEDEFNKSVFEMLGYTEAVTKKILEENTSRSKSNLNTALSYYIANDTEKAVPIFKELIKETNLFEIRAVSNSYLGRIEFSKGNLSEKSLNYLLEAEKLFKKFNIEDDDVNKVRASNYYDLAFYYKTHSHLFELAQTYYLKSIKIYEDINEISVIYNAKLGSAYNDLYILAKEKSDSKSEVNPIFYLKRAIHYKSEILGMEDKNNDNFVNYINSLDILANYYRMNGDYENSIKTMDNAVELLDEKLKKNPLDRRINLRKAELLVRYSNVYQTKFEIYAQNEDLIKAGEKLNEARLLFTEYTKTKVTLYDVAHFRDYYYSKGTYSRNLLNNKQSIEDFNTCLEYADTLSSQDNKNIDFIAYKANIFYELAVTYSNIKDCIQSKKYAKKAHDIYKEMIKSRKFYKKYLKACEKIIKNCS
ncbi:hypothetical protein MBM09_01540 [Flaviramulus sp. BrNp1-15]|uniref:hypothetical protein n=1 Tax=Flaviramulus sp. BrNp1-15 TaxID=2916754 RepID=UPI001EE891C1|nr:hypothetical protein [Flaviramulus sp. BrNp1-15]ULC59672.1 hypothetical protein MBM09_01540 [Flaviramulus sp. BrNp1-15]